MNGRQQGILAQVRSNVVALISLTLAISSLSYTTWRNELTEENRNYRTASFEILLKLGELQQLVFHSHYDTDYGLGNPRTGWAYVITIRDLAMVLPAPMPEVTDQLVSVWAENWEGLGKDKNSVELIGEAIDESRRSILGLLQGLQ